MYLFKKCVYCWVFFLLVSLSLNPLTGVSNLFNTDDKSRCLKENVVLTYSRNDNMNEANYDFNDRFFFQNQNCKFENFVVRSADVSYDTNSINGVAVSPWPMFCHDTKHTGLSPHDTSVNPYEEIWRINTAGPCNSGITIGVNDTLYTVSALGELYCILPNGTIQWKYKTNSFHTTSTPCIGSDDTIYCGSFERYLHAIYPNGTCKWKTYLGGAISSSPTIADDGTIYIGTMGGSEPTGSSMIALNPNGTIKWYYRTGEFITSDPAIANDGTIIFGSADTFIYALHPNGTMKWRYNTPNRVKGPASIDEQGVIYINCYDKYLYALYLNGTLKWKTDVDGFYGTETNPSFGPDGTIYLAADGLAAIDPEDGGVLWIFEFLHGSEYTFLSSPVVSADGTIYVGTMIDGGWGGFLYAIDPSGHLIWNKKISYDYTDSTPSIGSDGTVYMGSSWGYDGGAIHAFGEWNGTNHPPETPLLDGEGRALIWNPYELKIMGIDEDLHPMKYIVNWGDGTSTETIDIASDYQHTLSHQYWFPWRYKIRVQAVDTLGLESDWVEHTARISLFPSLF